MSGCKGPIRKTLQSLERRGGQSGLVVGQLGGCGESYLDYI